MRKMGKALRLAGVPLAALSLCLATNIGTAQASAGTPAIKAIFVNIYTQLPKFSSTDIADLRTAVANGDITDIILQTVPLSFNEVFTSPDGPAESDTWSDEVTTENSALRTIATWDIPQAKIWVAVPGMSSIDASQGAYDSGYSAPQTMSDESLALTGNGADVLGMEKFISEIKFSNDPNNTIPGWYWDTEQLHYGSSTTSTHVGIDNLTTSNMLQDPEVKLMDDVAHYMHTLNSSWQFLWCPEWGDATNNYNSNENFDRSVSIISDTKTSQNPYGIFSGVIIQPRYAASLNLSNLQAAQNSGYYWANGNYLAGNNNPCDPYTDAIYSWPKNTTTNIGAEFEHPSSASSSEWNTDSTYLAPMVGYSPMAFYWDGTFANQWTNYISQVY